MQRQKTIAKWLAVILLLTLAVASYVTLRAIFGGRTQDNVAGAQDKTDSDDSGIVTSYGGSTMLPQTIVLDQNGVIIYNTVGSVTYELLESLVKPLLEG